MELGRRGLLRTFLAGSVACALPLRANAEPITQTTFLPGPGWRKFKLANGLRAHLLANGTGYVSGALLLRSDQITPANGGLGHIMEHTSFTGAASTLSASEIKERHKDFIDDSNASTRQGAIEWQVSFLPERLSEALHILSMTSLDQRFDEETVESEAKVVLQELYLEKYGKAGAAQKRFLCALYGEDHPYALDTVDSEIAMAKTPPSKLAARLRDYAQGLRLPANMDLILAGGFDLAAAKAALESSFGTYPYTEGPMFDFPPVAVTRGYEKLAGPSHDLSRPMCELTLAWNTGVGIRDAEARTLMALREYLSSVLFLQLREKLGEAYTPEVEYDPDGCSGVFTITITSSADAAKVERSAFEAIALAKRTIDQREVDRFKGRAKLKRLKSVGDNVELVRRQLESVIHGASAEDLRIEDVSADDILAAAQRYLPAHRGSYVRLALEGQ